MGVMCPLAKHYGTAVIGKVTTNAFSRASDEAARNMGWGGANNSPLVQMLAPKYFVLIFQRETLITLPRIST